MEGYQGLTRALLCGSFIFPKDRAEASAETRESTVTTTPEFKREQKRILERRRRARTFQLYQRLHLQAEMLCESHRDEELEAQIPLILDRMLSALLELKKAYKLDDKARDSLVTILIHCQSQEFPYVKYDGNQLHINGYFDMAALAERMVWQGIEDQLRLVGAEDDT